MGDQEPKKQANELEASFAPTTTPPPPEAPGVIENKEGALNHVVEDKTVIPISEEKASPPPPPPPPPPAAAVKESAYPAVKKDIIGGGSTERDALYAQIETEKRLALIKAWEESEKTKAENKAYRRMSTVELWEDSKKTSVEAELKKIEEKFERKKAEYTEKMKNKVAEIHKAGDERRAFIEAKQREQCLRVEETAAKFRSTGITPKKLLLGCFICQHSTVR